jgi:energy-coupling factor transporter ATP-binding protein EcfA2
VLSYNVPGVAKPIRLSRSAYVKIFLGEITDWSDAGIAKDNPGVDLPRQNSQSSRERTAAERRTPSRRTWRPCRRRSGSTGRPESTSPSPGRRRSPRKGTMGSPRSSSSRPVRSDMSNTAMRSLRAFAWPQALRRSACSRNPEGALSRLLGRHAKSIDPVAVRRTIGMVFQKPNPFAMTVYRNVAYGLRLNGYKRQPSRKGRESAAGRRALGRSERQAALERPRAFGRPAAAPVHRALDRDRAGGAAGGISSNTARRARSSRTRKRSPRRSTSEANSAEPRCHLAAFARS